MAIRIQDLAANEREIVVKVDDEEAHISYRPQAFTPVLEDQMQSLLESNRPGNGLASTLSKMITKWDVLGEDGKPLPITVENLRSLPVSFLSLIMKAINEDNNTDAETRKNSGGGSLRTGN